MGKTFITVHFKLLFTSLKEIHGENKILHHIETRGGGHSRQNPFLDSCMINMPTTHFSECETLCLYLSMGIEEGHKTHESFPSSVEIWRCKDFISVQQGQRLTNVVYHYYSNQSFKAKHITVIGFILSRFKNINEYKLSALLWSRKVIQEYIH